MPFKSRQQARWMWAKKPAMAKRWASETPNYRDLPQRKKPGKGRRYYGEK